MKFCIHSVLLAVVLISCAFSSWAEEAETQYRVGADLLFSFSPNWLSPVNETNYIWDKVSDGLIDERDLLLLIDDWGNVVTNPGAIEMVSVPSGTFMMGRTDSSDDASYGYSDELPRHSVTLSAYQIGKYEITNGLFCDVLNWANARGYLKNSSGSAYAGSNVYTSGERLLQISSSNCQISYSGGSFVSESRQGYSMENHPVVDVSWYGSVAFCNWLSEKDGLSPCYNLSTWALATPYPNGYRLPTEAEWERAMAWDGSHRIYGYSSDDRPIPNTVNCYVSTYVNPLGLTSSPYTTPVGWFNGMNVSPNGSVQTVNSLSPAGCYDMSGNVWEWCQDWYDSSYYGSSPSSNPTGVSSGTDRVLRGGGWGSDFDDCRSACRSRNRPNGESGNRGFRLSRTP